MWVDYRGPLSTVYNDGGDLNMWVDYRGPLGTIYNEGEISVFKETIEAHPQRTTQNSVGDKYSFHMRLM